MPNPEPGSSRPYLIYRRNQGAGFWSNFAWILHLLDRADQQGLRPVVDMQRHPIHYSEPGVEASAELGTRNAWEYYFEQPAGLTVEEALAQDALESGGEVKDSWMDEETPERLARMRQLVGKYIRVKPEIQTQIDAILAPGNHPRVLGVHVRGTDARSGNHQGHPIPQPAVYLLEQAVLLDREHHFEHVYLATDEVDAVDLFRAEFGERLLVPEAHRTPKETPTAKDYQWLFGAERPLHRFRLGLEVLQDGLLLARCGHFLYNPSNVSRCAAYFADPAQVRYPLPPVWITAKRRVSVGREKLALTSPPPHPPSADVLGAQIAELHRLLESVENTRGKAETERDELLAQVAELKALQKENRRLEKSLAQSRKIIERLQKRLLEGLTGWTKLGWRLSPKSRPAWRHDPLKDCRVGEE